MIALTNICKSYPIHNGTRLVLNNINYTINPSEKIGILGKNGAGKSTLIRVLSGAERPTSGNIMRNMSLSWPLAFGGAFQGSLTGIDNIKFICRIYGVNYLEKIEYIDDFSELGKYLLEPIKNYSAGMRARLAFGISMAVEFDCFLIDEVVAVGDARFQEKCRIELFEKRKDRAMIIVSHDPGYIQTHCDKAAVLFDGKLHQFEDTEHAFEFYKERSS